MGMSSGLGAETIVVAALYRLMLVGACDGQCVAPPPPSAPPVGVLAPSADPVDIDVPKAPAVTGFTQTIRKRNPNTSGKRYCDGKELKPEEWCDVQPVREDFAKDARLKKGKK